MSGEGILEGLARQGQGVEAAPLGVKDRVSVM